MFARHKEYQRALQPWQDAIDIYRSLGVNEEDPKVACTLGNIEISKNLKQTPSEKTLRVIDVY